MVEFRHWKLNRTLAIILHDVALLLHLPGIMALLSIPICLWFGEFYAIKPFLETAIASFLPAQLLYRLCSPKVDATRLYHAMLIAALTWGFLALMGAIPFLAIAKSLALAPDTPQTVLAFQNGWNALFESFSGFTGTGLSMAKNASELPHSLQWWRSLMEWIDGVGVIIWVLVVLEPEVDASQLYYATGRQRTISNTISQAARDILLIYGFYTVLSILILMLLGMPWWEAINHGLTGIATGGFSITRNSITDYSSSIQLAISLIMLTGAIGFPIHYQLLRHRNGSAFWKSDQHRVLLLLLGFGTLALLLENRWSSGSFLWIESLFQWTSALTTCGFETVKIQNWSVSAKLLLSIAMLIGGAGGSTAGGLKLNRIVALYQGMRWRLQKLLQGTENSMHYRLNNQELSESDARQKVLLAAILTVLWLLLLGVGIFMLSHVVSSDYTLGDIVFEATSATSNVGLSTGISDPSLDWSGKLILILLMWAGRLEIIPILLLLMSITHLAHEEESAQNTN